MDKSKEKAIIYIKASTKKALTKYKEQTGIPMTQALERAFLKQIRVEKDE